MAFLNGTTIVCDAVLTKKGRELLSQGSSNFKITKFALADDEIDYGLWNPNHPSGSDYYGAVIEDTPILEANTDEALGLRYKLISLPQNSVSIPYILVSPTALSLTYNQSAVVIPVNYNALLTQNNEILGYTAVLHDANIASIQFETPAPGQTTVPTVPGNFGWTQYANSQTAVGLSFKVKGKLLTTGSNTLITIYGNETGGTATVALNVTPPVTSSHIGPA